MKQAVGMNNVPGDGAVVTLKAPLAGWLTALDDLPDPVFSERILGDGVAIDPFENLLSAPADGIVLVAHPHRYAVTLRLANGAELLLHVGLETFALAGRGFRLHVGAGSQVRAGDPLISFDMDALARRGKSLLTPMILLGDGFRVGPMAVDRALARGEVCLTVGPERACGLETAGRSGPVGHKGVMPRSL